MMSTGKLTRTALLAVVLADAALLAGRARATTQLHAARAPFSRALRQVPLPTGFLVSGGAYVPPSRLRCAAVTASTAAIRPPWRGGWPLPSAVRAASWWWLRPLQSRCRCLGLLPIKTK